MVAIIKRNSAQLPRKGAVSLFKLNAIGLFGVLHFNFGQSQRELITTSVRALKDCERLIVDDDSYRDPRFVCEDF